MTGSAASSKALMEKYPLDERELTYMDTRGLKGVDVDLYMRYFHEALAYKKKERDRKAGQYDKGGVKAHLVDR